LSVRDGDASDIVNVPCSKGFGRVLELGVVVSDKIFESGGILLCEERRTLKGRKCEEKIASSRGVNSFKLRRESAEESRVEFGLGYITLTFDY